MSPIRSAPLVPVELHQLWQRSADGFGGAVGFSVWHGRCGVDPTFQIGDPAARKYFEQLHRFEREPLYDEDISHVESPERTDLLNEGNFGSPNTRELQLGFSNGEGMLHEQLVFDLAGNFTGELLQLISKCRARADARA